MKILYIVRGLANASFFNNSDEMIDRAGNTGNKVFETAVEKYISHNSNTIDYMLVRDFKFNLTDKEVRDINNKYDTIVIALANNIHHNLEHISALLNQIKK